MVPVTENEIIYFNIKDDKNYSLLKKEHVYCIKHKEEIFRRAMHVYNLVTKFNKVSLIKRSSDFKLLEEKLKQYNNIEVKL